MARPYRFVEKKISPRQRQQFLADMADTAPYLDPIAVGRWVNTLTRREKRRRRKSKRG